MPAEITSKVAACLLGLEVLNDEILEFRPLKIITLMRWAAEHPEDFNTFLTDIREYSANNVNAVLREYRVFMDEDYKILSKILTV